MFVVFFKPFNHPDQLKLEIFNEISILTINYHTLVCTEWMSDLEIRT